MRFIMPRFFVNCERWKWNEDLRLYVSTHGHFKDEHKRNKACKVKDNYFWINVDGKWDGEKNVIEANRVVELVNELKEKENIILFIDEILIPSPAIIDFVIWNGLAEKKTYSGQKKIT